MTDLTQAIKEEQAKATTSPLIELFILTQTDHSPGFQPAIYRFTSSARSNAPISYGGNIYEALPIEADDYELKTSGTLASPVMRVALGELPLQSQSALDDILGWELTRIKTFARFLDDGETPDSGSYISKDTYRVEHKVAQTKQQIEWRLRSVLDQEGVNLPRQQVIRDFCTHTYRVWDEATNSFNYERVTCPLRSATRTFTRPGGGGIQTSTHSTLFDRADRPVQTGAEDECGRTVRSCTARFGRGISLPTTAFPGVREQ